MRITYHCASLGLQAELLAPVLNEDAPVSREVAGLYTEWMGQHMDVLGERTLLELTLPGTHDSGMVGREVLSSAYN